MIRVRQLEPEDGPNATNLWASAMKGSNYCEAMQKRIDEFVELKLNDPHDMGNVFLNYVQQQERPNDHENGRPTNYDKNHIVEYLFPTKNFWVVEHIETSADQELQTAQIVGCVGGMVRSEKDLSKITPEGKEYVPRINFEYPLWSKPLGIGISPNSRHAGVELVRMAVHPDYRGKDRTFSVIKSNGDLDANKKQSISQLLIVTLAKWALETNCKYVVLTTGRLMYNAVSAYKRFGFSGHELPESMAFSAEASHLIDQNSPRSIDSKDNQKCKT